MFNDFWQSLVKVGVASRTKAQRRGEAPEERLFCSQPFTRYEILGGGGDRGEVFSCCQSWITKSLGNMSERPVADVWNSKDAQKIRRSILDTAPSSTAGAMSAPTCSLSLELDRPENGRARAAAGGGDHSR